VPFARRSSHVSVTVSRHVTEAQLIDLGLGLAVMLVVNALLLRPLFAPLERLAGRMENVDILRGMERVPLGGPAEVGALEHAFNTMTGRLEEERREAGTRALIAQEEERQRIARGLHDEVGQTMTGVLFQLNRLATNAPSDQRPALAEAQDAVRTSLEEVRRIAQELRPEVLDHLGLRTYRGRSRGGPASPYTASSTRTSRQSRRRQSSSSTA